MAVGPLLMSSEYRPAKESQGASDKAVEDSSTSEIKMIQSADDTVMTGLSDVSAIITFTFM